MSRFSSRSSGDFRQLVPGLGLPWEVLGSVMLRMRKRCQNYCQKKGISPLEVLTRSSYTRPGCASFQRAGVCVPEVTAHNWHPFFTALRLGPAAERIPCDGSLAREVPCSSPRLEIDAMCMHIHHCPGATMIISVG